MAETVAVVFTLPLAAIGHVIYSLAGHLLDLGPLDKGKIFFFGCVLASLKENASVHRLVRHIQVEFEQNNIKKTKLGH